LVLLIDHGCRIDEKYAASPVGGGGRRDGPATDVSRKKPIRIGVSMCLLEERVRHDGGHKRDHCVTDTLAEFFEWVPVCPEVEVGMGTQREAIHQVDASGEIHLTMSDIGGWRGGRDRRVS
jgi:hypothetical protein